MATKVNRIIDADGHVNERPVLGRFVELLEMPYRSRVKLVDGDISQLIIDGGAPWPAGRGNTAGSAALRVRKTEGPLSTWHQHPDRCGMWDPRRRVKDMDVDSIDMAVLFPGPVGLAAHGVQDVPMATALSRAYNDWLAEYCKPFPKRLKGVAVLPVQDIAASVQELRRCVKDLGFLGGLMPNRPGPLLRNLDDPVYEPLWDEAQRLDVPICIHNNLIYDTALGERFNSYVDFKPIHDPAENMLAIQALIFGGVLDRFPRLRVAILEGGIGWIPFWADRLSEYYEEFMDGELKRGGPWEYVKCEQLYFSGEVEESTLGYVVKTIGADRIVFASDYYHHDCRFPGSTRAIQERTDLSAEAKAKVLGRNAAVLYGL